MAKANKNIPMKILHVLTLNGRSGEYGGPVRVAREQCQELNSRGHRTEIFSGAIKGSEPQPTTKTSESFVLVKPISQTLKLSSLWSWKLITPLSKLIRGSEIVHIHFARDLIPFLAALLSIIHRKPFITQTHGMIISDGRLSTRITDIFLTRRLINRSRLNLVLTNTEETALKVLKVKSQSIVLHNGVAIPPMNSKHVRSGKRIVFCSRLDKRKGLERFIALAEKYKKSNLKFEVYGPDGGELTSLISDIEKRNLSNVLEYRGSLPAENVQSMLHEVNLLVLPSKEEPFPMVILEALSVGTQVLIMPSCGFAKRLRDFEPAFVAVTDDLNGLIRSFDIMERLNFEIRDKEEVQAFCREEFSISMITDQLLDSYRRALLNA